MKTLTYFNAFKKANLHMQHARDYRRSSFGISVESDPYAIQYQRYERLARKLNLRILFDLEIKYFDYCWFCGMHNDVHDGYCVERKRAEQAQGEGEGE